MKLYAGPGRRRILPPLVFGIGVLWHLLRHRRAYDVVHTCSFPYFSLLAAALIRPLDRYRLVVDWFEVWSREYWREYLGRLGGAIGWFVQHLCVRVPQHAFCFSQLYAQRLREEGAEEVEVLGGVYTGPLEPLPVRGPAPVVLFAGRHIPEKQVPAIIPAVLAARQAVPELTATILGDGPDRGEVLRRIAEAGLEEVVRAPGFVSAEEVDELMSRALCVLLPSRREGYGLVVVEAAAHGTPSIVVEEIDNAAVELIEEGENGFVAASASPRDLADAIQRVQAAGQPLRERTAAWFQRNAQRVSLARSLELASAAYRGELRTRS
jgi:glycosyltransferase involved in cell wall biosynthesis